MLRLYYHYVKPYRGFTILKQSLNNRRMLFFWLNDVFIVIYCLKATSIQKFNIAFYKPSNWLLLKLRCVMYCPREIYYRFILSCRVTQCPILYCRVHVQCYPMPYTVLHGACSVLPNALYCTAGYVFSVTQCPILYCRVHVQCYLMPYTVLQSTCSVLPNALYCTAGYVFGVT